MGAKSAGCSGKANLFITNRSNLGLTHAYGEKLKPCRSRRSKVNKATKLACAQPHGDSPGVADLFHYMLDLQLGALMGREMEAGTWRLNIGPLIGRQ